MFPVHPIHLTLLAVLAASLTLCGQVAATPHERIVHATEAASLSTMDGRPWHVKLAVTAFDAEGKNPVEGTVEYWKSGEDWRRVIIMGDATATSLRHDGKTFHGTTGSAVPTVARDLFDNFLHAGPEPADIERATLQLGKQNFGKIALDCIMLASPVKGATVFPLGLFPTYCLDPGSDHLRVEFEIGDGQLTINKLGRFLDHDVPLEFALGAGAAVIGRAKVVSMATFAPAPETFLPTPVLTPLGTYNGTARISSAVIQGMKLKTVPPVYPDDARIAHLSGAVVLRAIIGTDGKVRSLKVISSPTASFALAAIAAVRQWTYRPYLLNGEPVDVDTTVVLNFNINP